MSPNKTLKPHAPSRQEKVPTPPAPSRQEKAPTPPARSRQEKVPAPPAPSRQEKAPTPPAPSRQEIRSAPSATGAGPTPSTSSLSTPCAAPAAVGGESASRCLTYRASTAKAAAATRPSAARSARAPGWSPPRRVQPRLAPPATGWLWNDRRPGLPHLSRARHRARLNPKGIMRDVDPDAARCEPLDPRRHARRRARASPRQGARDRRGHQDQARGYRAADDPDPARRRVGREGPRDGPGLVDDQPGFHPEPEGPRAPGGARRAEDTARAARVAGGGIRGRRSLHRPRPCLTIEALSREPLR